MKFLKGIMARKRDDQEAAPPAMSIETLQRDLDHSGLDRSLRDAATAWSEKAAQRPAETDSAPRGGDHDAGFDRDGLDHDERTVSRDIDWEDELGDEPLEAAAPFDASRGRVQTRPVARDEEFEDEFDDEFEDEFDELEPEEEQAIRDNALLVEEIRDAIAAVRHIESEEPKKRPEPQMEAKARKGWEHDEVFGRKAIARDRLARLSDSEDGDRILEETNSKMYDDDAATRRRQAMAHLKAAAAATKADRVLKRVVGRDPAIDPDMQVQYREDLANVVRQRGVRSEPVSRPLSRPRSRPAGIGVAVAGGTTPAEPMTYEQLRAAFTQGEAHDRATAPEHQSLPEDNEPAEAKMDVEKIDLKTALERQKAILKAEREALEAEIAAEARARAEAVATEPEEDDGDADELRLFRAEPGEDEEPETDARHRDLETADSDEFDEEENDLEDWDDGVAAASAEADDLDDEETDAPVDLTALDLPDMSSQSDDDLDEDDDGASPAASEPVRDLDLEIGEAVHADEEAAETGAPAVAAPVRKAGRVKTRLLGFQSRTDTRDVFAGKAATGVGPVRFPVGWLVVTQGEGFGHSFALLSGVSKIGRGDDQAVQLDFGDTSISRDNHAAIAFDEELNQFFLGHGGKSNVVRLNGKPVLTTEELYDGDEIRIGETTLKFIALCGEDFTWAETAGDDHDHARLA